MTHRDRSEYKTDSSVMAVCKPVTIPGMTGHVRRNTQGKEQDKGGQAYEALSKLVSDRNYLVHHKEGKDRAGYSFDFYEKVRMGADNAMSALSLLFTELDKLHDGKTNYAAAILNTNECHA